jgi:hypothetical protein
LSGGVQTTFIDEGLNNQYPGENRCNTPLLLQKSALKKKNAWGREGERLGGGERSFTSKTWRKRGEREKRTL